jgi:hypothetical protein
MARVSVVASENLDILEISSYREDVAASLLTYFRYEPENGLPRFVGYTPQQLSEELAGRLSELDKSVSMTILSAVEAAFQIDFQQRCDRKGKDSVSRACRELRKKKERDKRARRIDVDEDIFEIWKKNATGTSEIISNLRSLFRYRHWLAHGRYWIPKLGRQYDYYYVYEISQKALNSFPLFRPVKGAVQ